MSIIIYKRNRLYLKLYKFFIKLSLTNLNPFMEKKKVKEFYRKTKIIKINSIYYSIRILKLNIEISKRINNYKKINDYQLFVKLENLLNDYNNLKKISWEKILSKEDLSKIKLNFKEIYKLINSTIGTLTYPDSGMHGDFTPGNILSDFNNEIYLIDWELSQENGSFKWDIYDYYCTFCRETPYPGLDIISIKNKSKYDNLKEMLIIYSLMKFRKDLYRHKKDFIKSIQGLEERLKIIHEK